MKKFLLSSIKLLLKIATNSKYVEQIFILVKNLNNSDISNSEKLVKALTFAEELAESHGVDYNKNVARLIIELAVTISKM